MFKQIYIVGKVFLILSISLLYPKESFISNFKTARKKDFSMEQLPNDSYICYYVNKRILFQLINKP